MNPELQRWLDTATHNLAPGAAQRVQDEYLAAFQDAQVAGETHILATWGDPRRVNWELRRVHLTVTDMRWLAWMLPSSVVTAKQFRWLIRALLWSAPLFIGGNVWATLQMFDVSWTQAVAGSVAFQALAIACIWLGERLDSHIPSREEAGVAGLFFGMVFFAAFMVFHILLPWPELQMQGLIFGVIAFTLLASLWSGLLWRKVRRAVA